MPRKLKARVCEYCSKQFYLIRRKFCCDECMLLGREDNRVARGKKISISRKKYLKANPEAHNWSRMHKKSAPCDKFKDELTDHNISFIEEYQPLEDRYFKLDIAFPDKKIGIEINGNQHYNADGTLAEYYQDRHDLIEKAGWKIYEYHYSMPYDPLITSQIIKTLKDGHELGDIDYSFYIQKRKNRNKYGTRQDYKKARFTESAEKEIPNVKLVLESNIDFSRSGWVSKVAEIIGKKPQKVNKWMKRYMATFYENSCFKRKSQLTNN